MKLRPMPRRRFLFTLAAAFAPLALAGIGWLGLPGANRATIAGILSDLVGAREIGMRYLAFAPYDADRSTLALHLFGGLKALPDSSDDYALLRRQIASKREQDFALGDTVILDGWILARTEARLCAFAALS